LLDTACEFAVKEAERTGATEAEAYGVTTKESEIFIENNDVKQGKLHETCGIGIRVFINRSVGFSFANKLDKNSIRMAIRKALKLGSASPHDKYNLLPSADLSKCNLLQGLYDKSAESFTIVDSAEMASRMIEIVKSIDSRVSIDSGGFNNSIITHSIYNSNGSRNIETISSFFWSILGMAIDGLDVSNFDYQFGGCHRVQDINVCSTAKLLAETTINSLGARKIQSFRGQMILSPNAVSELVQEVISYSVNSSSVQKKGSSYLGKLRMIVSSDLLTVDDDPTNLNSLAASSFDREGVPHKLNPIIERGILNRFLYNTYTAAKDGVETTGNAGGSARSAPLVSSSNIVIDAGSADLETLISEIGHGIIMNRFSGNVNPVNGEFSGVVKAGHYIVHGERAFPVKELMVAGNIIEGLHRITGISKERKLLSDSLLPYLRIDDISFTAG
jgi:PmbA protein